MYSELALSLFNMKLLTHAILNVHTTLSPQAGKAISRDLIGPNSKIQMKTWSTGT